MKIIKALRVISLLGAFYIMHLVTKFEIGYEVWHWLKYIALANAILYIIELFRKGK